jgi:hypothetical protein
MAFNAGRNKGPEFSYGDARFKGINRPCCGKVTPSWAAAAEDDLLRLTGHRPAIIGLCQGGGKVMS